MKVIKFIPVIFILSACSSLRVNMTMIKNIDFNQYKTYAFHKKGEIESKSDWTKKNKMQ
jgi:hypothetical protein